MNILKRYSLHKSLQIQQDIEGLSCFVILPTSWKLFSGEVTVINNIVIDYSVYIFYLVYD